jgi:hypothetical protein
MTVSDFEELSRDENGKRPRPEKSLLQFIHRKKGRNNRGVITCRHRGGGHKRLYRIIDFRRDKRGIPATVKTVEYAMPCPWSGSPWERWFTMWSCIPVAAGRSFALPGLALKWWPEKANMSPSSCPPAKSA